MGSKSITSKSALIIRFNAIGDIVLTSPVIDALYADGYQVHYLVKSSFMDVLIHDQKIYKVWILECSLDKVISKLKDISFSVVIDLHNNIRSKQVKSALKAPAFTLTKKRLQLWMLTQTPFKSYQEQHIVNRFLNVLAPLGSKVSNPKTRYALDGVQLPTNIIIPNSPYLVIAVGAAWETKRISEELLLYICESTSFEEIILIGGSQDQPAARRIATSRKEIIDLTGQLTISQSALMISKASVVLTGDTGPMHIAAALNIPVVAIFGSTHPSLGYTPHYGDLEVPHHLVSHETLSCRPCTKQGKNACPKGHFKCMLDLDKYDILKKVDSFCTS